MGQVVSELRLMGPHEKHHQIESFCAVRSVLTTPAPTQFPVKHCLPKLLSHLFECFCIYFEVYMCIFSMHIGVHSEKFN